MPSRFLCFSQCKNGISALELSRRLGVAYNTAWMLHAYIGGARSDGTTGRSASGNPLASTRSRRSYWLLAVRTLPNLVALL